MIQLIAYTKQHQADFKRLNLEWINAHAVLGAHDHHVLEDPERYILANDGQIILAAMEKEIVGTIALSRNSKGRLELSKLSVTSEFRGNGIGKRLTEEVINRAKNMGEQELFLWTNQILKPAIALYEKLGFEQINQEGKTPHCDIEMSLKL